ncbi:UNVERIFIED_CONTAM: hypothetical protein HDU68_010233 [Siphonaria sp. JEL0065]|nr:hypothetical protein HDU68_010233 [Siphonaria sp. JEL0065]
MVNKSIRRNLNRRKQAKPVKAETNTSPIYTLPREIVQQIFCKIEVANVLDYRLLCRYANQCLGDAYFSQTLIRSNLKNSDFSRQAATLWVRWPKCFQVSYVQLVLSTTSKLEFKRPWSMLKGRIPGALALLTDLETLDLWGNVLVGPLPQELSTLKKLKLLSVPNNTLSGSVPLWLFEMPSLQTARLSVNYISGLPTDIPWNDTLKELEINYTKLGATIPSTIRKLKKLETLGMRCSELVGKIPSTLGSLTYLKNLDLGSNKLFGGIPVELGKLKNLENLDLSENGLTGEIPCELKGLEKLRVLNLSKNSLVGMVPTALGALVSLEEVDLSNNSFEGGLPGSFVNMERLNSMDVSGNILDGDFPGWLFGMTTLREVSFKGNLGITGYIDDRILGMENLRDMDLKHTGVTIEKLREDAVAELLARGVTITV